MTTKTYPKSYFTFGAEVEVGSNGDDAKTAPFSMVARSGEPINHHALGRIVHDLAGMTSKSRVAIDWEHSDKLLGYANRFDVADGNLNVSGALIPYGDDDLTSEIIFKASKGVPLEASISWGSAGDGELVFQEVEEGESAEVNGYQFQGPGIIARKWTLRGIAICRNGYDANTSTNFADDDEQITVKVIDTRMSDTSNTAETTVVEAEKTNELSNDQRLSIATEAVEQLKQESPESLDVEGQDGELDKSNVEPSEEGQPKHRQVNLGVAEHYMSVFGESDGAIYFAKGFTFTEACEKHLSCQRQRIEELESQLANRSIERGYDEPIQFQAIKEDKPQGFINIK